MGAKCVRVLVIRSFLLVMPSNRKILLIWRMAVHSLLSRSRQFHGNDRNTPCCSSLLEIERPGTLEWNNVFLHQRFRTPNVSHRPVIAALPIAAGSPTVNVHARLLGVFVPECGQVRCKIWTSCVCCFSTWGPLKSRTPSRSRWPQLIRQIHWKGECVNRQAAFWILSQRPQKQWSCSCTPERSQRRRWILFRLIDCEWQEQNSNDSQDHRRHAFRNFVHCLFEST